MGLEYFTENNIKVIENRLKEDLKLIGMKYGIDFTISDFSYSRVGFDVHVVGELNNVDSQKHLLSEQERLVKEFCEDKGIENLYGKSFVLGEYNVTVTGVNTNRKDTLLVKDTDGRTLNVGYELLIK